MIYRDFGGSTTFFLDLIGILPNGPCNSNNTFPVRHHFSVSLNGLSRPNQESGPGQSHQLWNLFPCTSYCGLWRRHVSLLFVLTISRAYWIKFTLLVASSSQKHLECCIFCLQGKIGWEPWWRNQGECPVLVWHLVFYAYWRDGKKVIQLSPSSLVKMVRNLPKDGWTLSHCPLPFGL